MNQKGVTLIELIVVIVIIGIMGVLMVPNIGGWLPNYRLRSAARDIASTLRVAQMKAVSNNLSYGVVFDTANQQFQLYRNTTGLPLEGVPASLPSGVAFNGIAGIPFDGPSGLPSARFFADSTASADGMITLKNTKNMEKQVQVFRSTGRIRIP
jgi:prepilin-type N-terminal cleavage/methylation domain-containing protein